MKNKIYTKNDQKSIEITPAHRALVKKAINETLEYEEVEFDCEVSVTFCSADEIKRLNAEFRNKDSVTDVLSFPMLEDGEIDEDEIVEGEPIALGDIVICAERADEQSKEYGHSFEREICFLAVHSTLHLLGLDHEADKSDELYMNRVQEEILAKMGLPRENSGGEKEGASHDEKNEKTGFIAIIGRPNVGKSTFMNAALGEKVAIVSSKPQTTRNRITGVLTRGDCQYVFIDTPGIHKPKNKLGEFMMKSADESLTATDGIVFIADACEMPGKSDIDIIGKIRATGAPAVLVLNKTDIAKKDKLLTVIAKYNELYEFKSIIPISALNNDGVDTVIEEITAFLRPERWYFPEDMITDQPERQICAEIIREKLLRLNSDEIPHGIAVVIEDFKEEKNLVRVRAEIYCEKQAHKKIIIGKNGEALKKVATYAREDMENLLGEKVFLDLWVKVKENWRDNALSLNRLGFKEEK